MRNFVVSVSLAVAFVACGGGGGGGGSESTPPDSNNPDVALILVSGHEGLFDATPSRSYLDDEFGPTLAQDLRSAGFSVATYYFVDHWTMTDYSGYDGLVSRLIQIRDEWVYGASEPTEVVVVSHSHGGVWATAALRQVWNLPIAAHVALDHSSYGWSTVGHDAANAMIGGDPRSAYVIEQLVTYPNYPQVPSEQTYSYDLEDVVMPSVWAALEVRSADSPLGGELYDERWNCRLDGSLSSLYGYYSGGSHEEVRQVTGTTYPNVLGWLLQIL